MIRTLLFMGLMSVSIIIPSCCLIMPCSVGRVVEPIDQTMRERLKELRKETDNTVVLTTEKLKRNEVDFQIGNKIVDTLTTTIRQIDSLITVSVQLGKTCYSEQILMFAHYSDQLIRSMRPNLKSLRDLYDISTNLQFETASFFPSDSFNISTEKIDEAQKEIEPAAQRILRFIADHPQQKFEVVIACSGTTNDQNVKLCIGRARSVAYLLANQIRSQKDFIPRPEWIHYNIKWVDRKEGLPPSGIISIIWNLVPTALCVGVGDR